MPSEELANTVGRAPDSDTAIPSAWLHIRSLFEYQLLRLLGVEGFERLHVGIPRSI